MNKIFKIIILFLLLFITSIFAVDCNQHSDCPSGQYCILNLCYTSEQICSDSDVNLKSELVSDPIANFNNQLIYTRDLLVRGTVGGYNSYSGGTCFL